MDDESSFLFNVPTNVSFTKPFDDFDENVDRYFDINNENNPPNDQPDAEYSRFNEKSVYFSPALMFGEQESLNIRRSMSVGNLVMFCENEDRQEESSTLDQVRDQIVDLNINQDKPNDQKKIDESKCTTTTGQSLNNLNRFTESKRFASTEKLTQSRQEKYVSFAEAVSQFQNRTPVRFRSKPNQEVATHNSAPLHITFPQSPSLQTKARSRPTDHIQSAMERELMEFENIRKFKIKARPVNKKILLGPVKPHVPVEKRPHTVLQPFNITQVQPKKVVVPQPPKFVFHASPAPKLRTPPQITSQSSTGKTIPVTPQFMKNYKPKPRLVASRTQLDEKPLEKTVPVPFSFEERDKMVKRKRDQYIEKILDEERRARQFHANPVPKAIYKAGDSLRRNSASSTDSIKRSSSSMDMCSTEFKARPATVLLRQPFIPAPASKPVTEPVPFRLESEMRRQEREQFEREKRLKEEHLEILKKEMEEKQLQLEKQEVLRLRKEAEQKAQPIKKFKPVLIKPSHKVTVPVSPKMHKK